MQLLKHVANAMLRAEGFVLERALVFIAPNILSVELNKSIIITRTAVCGYIKGTAYIVFLA